MDLVYKEEMATATARGREYFSIEILRNSHKATQWGMKQSAIRYGMFNPKYF